MLPIILAIRDENDQHFVAEVYSKYSDRMQAIVKKYLDNGMDVEDCVQDVIIVLINYLEEYRTWDERHRLNFLMKCCRCIAINKYKENKKRRSKESSLSKSDDEKDLEIFDEDSYLDRILISEDTLKLEIIVHGITIVPQKITTIP